MTRHYTHVGELAAGRAVAALPAVLGKTKPEKPERQQGEILRDIQTIAETISAKNWREKKPPCLKCWRRSRNGAIARANYRVLLWQSERESIRLLADNSVSGAVRTANRLDSKIPAARWRPGKMHFFNTPCRASKSTNPNCC